MRFAQRNLHTSLLSWIQGPKRRHWEFDDRHDHDGMIGVGATRHVITLEDIDHFRKCAVAAREGQPIQLRLGGYDDIANYWTPSLAPFEAECLGLLGEAGDLSKGEGDFQCIKLHYPLIETRRV